MTIVTRQVGANAKGSPLTNEELDGNFLHLDNVDTQLRQLVSAEQAQRTEADNQQKQLTEQLNIRVDGLTTKVAAVPDGSEVRRMVDEGLNPIRAALDTKQDKLTKTPLYTDGGTLTGQLNGTTLEMSGQVAGSSFRTGAVEIKPTGEFVGPRFELRGATVAAVTPTSRLQLSGDRTSISGGPLEVSRSGAGEMLSLKMDNVTPLTVTVESNQTMRHRFTGNFVFESGPAHVRTHDGVLFLTRSVVQMGDIGLRIQARSSDEIAAIGFVNSSYTAEVGSVRTHGNNLQLHAAGAIEFVVNGKLVQRWDGNSTSGTSGWAPPTRVDVPGYTASSGGHYVIMHGGETHIHAPANPKAGDAVRITIGNGRDDNKFQGNGRPIMGTNEGTQLDLGPQTYEFVYTNERGWVI